MKEDRFHQRIEELDTRINTAWKAMHHNASLARLYPSFRNEFEDSLFWKWLSREANREADRVEHLIEERFGICTKVFSAGRCGATMYPELFHRSIGGNGFGSFKWDHFHKRYDSYREEIQDRERVARMLEWFNKHWRAKAAKVASEWSRHKRSNSLSREIRRYDGKTQQTVTVWV